LNTGIAQAKPASELAGYTTDDRNLSRHPAIFAEFVFSASIAVPEQ
jgi:hypothetical protein